MVLGPNKYGKTLAGKGQGMKAKAAQTAFHDVELVLEVCPPNEDEFRDKVSRLIVKYLTRKGYRFLLRLKGPRFEECIDSLRPLIQEFINASFTIVEDPFQTNGSPRLAYIVIRASKDNSFIIVEKEVKIQ